MKTIVLPATLDQLENINLFLKEEIPEEFAGHASKIELAVEELLANICLYAYNGAAGEVELGCCPVKFDGAPLFRILVRDWGPKFDPFAEQPKPDLSLSLEDRPIGGLGLFLISNVAEHYCYSYWQGANSIELYFSKPEAA